MSKLDDDETQLEGGPIDASQSLLPSRSVNKTKLTLRSGCILLSELCERLAYYSIDANLILLFTNLMDMGNADANTLSLSWKGTVYLCPLIGGWIADSHWGRYKTIIVGVILYIISMIGLAVGVIPSVVMSHNWVIIVALFTVALATGGIKANVVTFGADQFSDLPPGAETEAIKQTFFNWFYFSINVGAMLAYTVIAFVQQEISFVIGLAIPAGIMFLSSVFFVAGTSWYIRLPPSGSILSKSFKIIGCAIKSRFLSPKNISTTFYTDFAADESAADDDRKEKINNKVEEEDSIADDKSVATESVVRSNDFLDRAKYFVRHEGGRVFSDNSVDNLKQFFKVVPILSFFIVFWCLYAQMGSVFFTQGTVMRLQTGALLIPVTSLNVFNTGAILILVPIFERGLYPLLRRYNVNFGMLRRIGLGMLLATLGMLYAGCLEVVRLDMFKKGYTITQMVGSATVVAVDMSVFWQAPGFFLIGAGEVLASITGLEFAYSQSPPTMKSMVIAFFYVTTGLGNYLGSALIASVNSLTSPSWINQNLNKSRMDLYFFVLTGIGFVNFFGYSFVAMRYRESK